MNRTKAAFRASREECGLTQKELAEEVGVTVKTIKTWENPAQEWQPPDDAWRFLAACRAAMHHDARELADRIEATYQGVGDVLLDYHRTQESLDAAQASTGTDEPVGYHNARTRLIAYLLEQDGVPVTFVYPDK